MNSKHNADTPVTSIADRFLAEYLAERNQLNRISWENRSNWSYGFYFGHMDSRLWVPRRLRNGRESEDKRVINFCHPLGRKPFQILVLAYFSSICLGLAILAAILGTRW